MGDKKSTKKCRGNKEGPKNVKKMQISENAKKIENRAKEIHKKLKRPVLK